MTAPTCAVTTYVYRQDGAPDAGATVTAKLNSFEIDSGLGYVVPKVVSATADASGYVVINLWPNELGSVQSAYNITIRTSDGRTLKTTASVPNQVTITLEACSVLPLYPGKVDGQVAVEEAVAAASNAFTSATNAAASASAASTSASSASASATSASTSATNAATSATSATSSASSASTSASSASTSATSASTSATNAAGSATAAATSATNAANSATAAASSATNASNSATNASTSELNALNSATNAGTSATAAAASISVVSASLTNMTAALAIMLGYANTTTAQAGLAQTYVQQAASVAQQDLSGATLAALHRSPNAVVATAIYNVAEDSDPRWPDRCGALSYANETLQGAWLGAQASEVMARLSALSLGTELCSNGTFDNGVAGWVPTTAGSTTWLPSGRMQLKAINGASGADVTTLSVPVTAGKVYRVSCGFMQGYDASGNVSNGQARIELSVSAGTLTYLGTTSGVPGRLLGPATASDPQVQYVVPSASGNLFLVAGTASNAAFSPINYTAQFDNISVKEATGAYAPSGSYYQLSTDGKFYRLWKNLLASNRDFTTASWTKNGVTAQAAAAGTAPDGVSAATLIYPTASGSGKNIQQLPASAAGSTFASTYKIKAAGIGFAFVYNAQGNQVAYVNLTTGATSNVGANITGIASSIDGAGWVTVTFNSTSSAGTANWVVGPCDAAGSQAVTANGTNGILVWDGQLEYGATATATEAKIGTDTGTTEVTRGNKAKPPKSWGIVAEASRTVVYDMLEPGRPMWMVFTSTWTSPTGAASILTALAGNPLTGIAMRDGVMTVVANNNTNLPVMQVNFAKDAAYGYVGNAFFTYKGTIANRNAGLGFIQGPNLTASVGSVGNAVAMCTMPDAPVDPVTGLQVPTIAVATAAGMSLIKHDGSVVNSASASSYVQVSIDRYAVAAVDNSNANFVFALSPASLTAGFALTSNGATGVLGGFVKASSKQQVLMGRASYARVTNVAPYAASLIRLNESNPAASLTATIADTYNTGWMLDPRRVLLCDTKPGTMNGTNKLQNGTFDTDIANWTSYTPGAGGGAAWQSPGAMRATGGSGNFAGGYQDFTTVIGQAYTVTGSWSLVSGTIGATGIYAYNGAFGTLLGQTTTSGTVFSFVATGTVTRIYCAAAASAVIDFDNILVGDGVADCSYKAKPLTVYGTLTKTAVAAGAQLVAYSGFSAANYLQESASTDLDPANGSLRVGVYGSIPANVAAAGWGVDRSAATGAYYRLGHSATGQIVGELFDGTTTRTVTTTATYATGQLIKAVMEYATSGTLTIRVNGEVAATATGTPLASLSNASAVLTVGQRRALDAPWAGSLCMVKIGMTTASDDASKWMYQQELAMFQPGAQITLPDSGALVGLDYDSRLGAWLTASAANESSFNGLVRSSSAAAAAGSISLITGGSGAKMVSRTTTNPGVDVTLPAQNLKEELLRGSEYAAQRSRAGIPPMDFMGGFTANTTNGQTSITVTGSSLVIPANCTLKGAAVSGTGIPGGTTVTDVVGTTVYLSAPCTATNSGITVSIKDFIGPPGYEPHFVGVAGAGSRETTSWTRGFDGFRPRVSYSSAPGNQWLQIEWRKSA